MGRTFVAMNIMWAYAEQKSFGVSEAMQEMNGPCTRPLDTALALLERLRLSPLLSR